MCQLLDLMNQKICIGNVRWFYFDNECVLCLITLGVSLGCYGIRYFSLRDLGFNGYFLVRTFDPPSPPLNNFLVWVPLLVETLLP